MQRLEIEVGGGLIMNIELPNELNEDEIDEEVAAYVEDMFYPARIPCEWRKVGED